MKTKKYKQGLVTSLTALSTAMLCQTAATYASDIEIYKAPTTGGATLQLVLDMSSSMVQPAKDVSGGNGNPIKEDFDITCAKSYSSSPADNLNGRAYALTQTRTYRNLANTLRSYSFEGRFCNVKTTDVDSWSASTTAATKKKGDLIKSSCTLVNTFYRCPDRLTSLKHSLFDLILGGATTKALPSTVSIGISTFPTYQYLNILSLKDPDKNPANPNDTNWDPKNEVNKHAILSMIAPLGVEDGTHLSRAYADGSARLIKHISTAEASCAGYGVYFLTDGEAYNDNRATANSNIKNYLTEMGAVDTQCNSSRDGNNSELSWKCVGAIATQLYAKKTTAGGKNINNEIKTAVVGFGKDFSFKDANGINIVFSDKDTEAMVKAKFPIIGQSTSAQKGQQAAALAAFEGKGGWFSADNTQDVVDSVQNFVNSIKIPIPAITTGTSAIPQDVLNTSVIQPYAYFPQFQPKPSEEFRTWAGNLKKYKVDEGLLKDKNNAALFSSAGVLNTTNEDLWTPNYATGTTLTADQQSLKALGGLLSRLNLKKTGSNLNRKVFTSDGTTLTAVDEAYIKGAPAARGYYLGLLGYNVTTAQVAGLTTAQSVETLMASVPELRQVGAVMHSTPVLLTQSGKITFVPAQAAKEAVPATATEPAQPAVAARAAYNDTTNRDDYILFGTTQGVLHVVKAGKSDEITTVGNTAGEEVFAFVPQEMLAAQGKAFLDPPQTVVEGSTTNGMNNLYYGVDGAWTAHTEYVYNNVDETFKVYDTSLKYGKQWVYGGLRMGGRSYYALDLTNLDSPAVKFRIDPANNSVDGFTTPSGEGTRYEALGKMGQSWSKPTIANVQWKGKRRLVMFVGGGYDSTGGSDGKGYETFNYNQTNGVGAGVYMFDANTGEFLWSSYDAKAAAGAATTYIGHGDELKYSVVSQIKGVDRDGDGDVDHLYFGDLGGQVFRIDLDSVHNASTGTAANYAKQITRIYNGHAANGVSPRFYEMPAFTVYSGTGGTFAVISIGSGNRSTPLLGKKVNTAYIVNGETDALNETFINDGIYNIYDKGVIASTPPEPATSPTIGALHQLTDTQRTSAATLATWREVATVVGTGASAVNHTAKSGWYYPFTSSQNVGDRKAIEKVQGDLIAIDNDLYVSTFDAEGIGSTEACGAGIYGSSRAHRFCMPYGQCASTDTVTNNTLVLGKGLLGITMGPGTSGADRRIIAPLGSLPNGNKITGTTYSAANKLIPQSWYEKN